MSPELKPVRVAVVVNSLDRGGAERIVVDLARGLAPARWRSHLFTFGKETDALMTEARKVFLSVDVIERHTRMDPLVARRLASALHRRTTAEGPFGLVHAHLPWAGLHSRFAARAVGLPSVYTEHSLPMSRHPITRVLNAATITMDDATVAVSEVVEEGLLRRVPRARVHLIPNGVPVPPRPSQEDRERARAALGVEPGALVLGTVANLRSSKAQDILIEAFAIVSRERPDTRLVMVGADQGSGPMLREVVGRLRLADRVSFLGPRGDAVELMCGFDVFVLSSRFEGLPLALLEAMMRAVPVVSTAVGGIPTAVESGVSGRLAAPGSPGALADAILKTLADADGARRMGEAARRRAVADFSVGAMVAKYERVYEQVLTKS